MADSFTQGLHPLVTAVMWQIETDALQRFACFPIETDALQHRRMSNSFTQGLHPLVADAFKVNSDALQPRRMSDGFTQERHLGVSEPNVCCIPIGCWLYDSTTYPTAPAAGTRITPSKSVQVDMLADHRKHQVKI